MMRAPIASCSWSGVVAGLLALAVVPLPAAGGAGKARRQDRAPATSDPWIAQHLDELVKLYTHFHTHPELSRAEVETSKRVALELEKAGASITSNVGGYGVVGILKNGEGPVVLVRTDMDALPVVEETGLAYASTVKTRDKAGRDVGVMHACGHDVHMTSFIGTARWLADHRDRWSGTVLLVAQPAEEAVDGARNMLKDGLYTRFPKPDFALHFIAAPTSPSARSGTAPGPRSRARLHSRSPSAGKGAMAPGPTARSTRSSWPHLLSSISRRS